MKKNLKFLLIIVLTLSMPLVTFATTISDSPLDETVTVDADFGSSFTVTIPDKINLSSNFANGEERAGTANISAENVLIDDGQYLQIFVSSSNNWNLSNGQSSIVYRVEAYCDPFCNSYNNNWTSDYSSTDSILIINPIYDNKDYASAELTFYIGSWEDVIGAGKFTDTLTFDIQVN